MMNNNNRRGTIQNILNNENKPKLQLLRNSAAFSGKNPYTVMQNYEGVEMLPKKLIVKPELGNNWASSQQQVTDNFHNSAHIMPAETKKGLMSQQQSRYKSNNMIPICFSVTNESLPFDQKIFSPSKMITSALSKVNLRLTRNGFAVKQSMTVFESRIKSIKSNQSKLQETNPFASLIEKISCQRKMMNNEEASPQKRQNRPVVLKPQQQLNANLIKDSSTYSNVPLYKKLIQNTLESRSQAIRHCSSGGQMNQDKMISQNIFKDYLEKEDVKSPYSKLFLPLMKTTSMAFAGSNKDTNAVLEFNHSKERRQLYQGENTSREWLNRRPYNHKQDDEQSEVEMLLNLKSLYNDNTLESNTRRDFLAKPLPQLNYMSELRSKSQIKEKSYQVHAASHAIYTLNKKPNIINAPLKLVKRMMMKNYTEDLHVEENADEEYEEENQQMVQIDSMLMNKRYQDSPLPQNDL